MNYSETYEDLLKYRKNKGQEYPSWYSQHLSNNQAINIDKFQGDFQNALKFYTKEVKKLQFANFILNSQLQVVTQQKKKLMRNLNQLDSADRQSGNDKKKRVRRCANEIERRFVCQVKDCQKSYGTEGSMTQHMRLKHPEIQYNGLCFEVKVENVDKVKHQ